MSLPWALGVILFWGLGGFLTKYAAQRIGMQVLMWRIFLEMGISLAFLGMTGALKPFQLDRWGIAVAVLAGIAGTLGMVGYYFLLDRYQASRVVPFTSLYPQVTVILATAFLREKLTLAQWAGALLAVGAIVLLGSGRGGLGTQPVSLPAQPFCLD